MNCSGINQVRVDFLRRGQYDAVFCILDENCDDNMPVSLVITEQLLHKAKDFSDSHNENGCQTSKEAGVAKGAQPAQMTQTG